MSPAALRVLAVPAGRLAASVAALVTGIGLVAGAIRTGPVLLAPGVAGELVPVFARAVAGAALETAVLVAPSVAFAVVAAGLVARGELRALAAVGVRPVRLVTAAWPVLAALVVASATTATLWGREASAPGRFVQALVERARESCPTRGTSDVPLLGATWVCLAGEPPRLVSAPFGGGAAAIAAKGLDVTDDLATTTLHDATLLVRARGATPELRIRTAETTLHGVLPVLRASNLAPWMRALTVAGTTTLLAIASLGAVLTGRVQARGVATAIGAAGPAASLLVFSALERDVAPALAYAAVPGAGLAAIAVGFAVARRLHAGGQLER